LPSRRILSLALLVSFVSIKPLLLLLLLPLARWVLRHLDVATRDQDLRLSTRRQWQQRFRPLPQTQPNPCSLVVVVWS